ncbi:hypothetical protein CDAR_11991 [Caerostris darwini]|uniref:Uncharacterized protein n=1 Tax=Caerostris darwini TaxID=1538125 RepID=A0AAV4M3G3_9ARAC|nr:hypothetical protein CDAR_11991 [Caerostris darwini]
MWAIQGELSGKVSLLKRSASLLKHGDIEEKGIKRGRGIRIISWFASPQFAHHPLAKWDTEAPPGCQNLLSDTSVHGHIVYERPVNARRPFTRHFEYRGRGAGGTQ